MALINCPECGKQISDKVKACPHCGYPFEEQQTSPNDSAIKKHKVTIFRESQMYLLNPPINISINGVKRLSIANGQTLEIDLEEGDYTFEFSCSFRSREINLKLLADTQITLKWNRFTGALMANVF